MSLSLTNRDDIIANSYSLITSDGVVDLLDVVGGTLSTATLAAINVSVDAKITAIVGAAPAALNTLVELSAALGDDHNYATTITTALAAKAPKASPTFTGTAIAPQIMFDYNSNAPTLTTRSEGTKLVLYPSITSAQADYAIGVESSNMWLSVADAGNGFKFYGKTTNVATISGNGNFSCNGGVACSGLTVSGALLVGTTNVATALGEKATTTDLDLKAPKANPTFTGALTCAGTGGLTVSGSRDNVAQSITNNQLNGFSSLYFNNTSGASTSEVGQIFCGQTVGLNLQTNTAHPLRFSTYMNASNQFYSVLPSMTILANATRDVEIFAPLKVNSSLSTFTNNVIVGGRGVVDGNSFNRDGKRKH